MRFVIVEVQSDSCVLTKLQHYNHIARVKIETGEAAYKSYVERYTPEQIRIANIARKELNRKSAAKSGKKLKYPEIKDERVVTRPRNAFIQFVTNRATSADFNNILSKDRMKLIGAEWKEMSADEKAVRIFVIHLQVNHLLTVLLDRNTRIWPSRTRIATLRNTRTLTATICLRKADQPHSRRQQQLKLPSSEYDSVNR